MNKFLIVSGLMVLGQLSSVAQAADQSSYAKGHCAFAGQNIAMARVGNASHGLGVGWRAELDGGLQGEVSFAPGYGMTFITLTITENGHKLASSQMWASGVIGADATSDDATPGMDRYDALSLSVEGATGTVSCAYSFFERRLGG